MGIGLASQALPKALNAVKLIVNCSVQISFSEWDSKDLQCNTLRWNSVPLERSKGGSGFRTFPNNFY